MNRTVGWISCGLLIVLSLAIGGFSLFVGYHKAFSPLEELKHSAWTIHLPVLLGRAVGLAELVAAGAMILAIPFRRYAIVGAIGAGWITFNHAAATLVHILHAEWHTLTQSAVMITLCLILTALWRDRAR